MKRFLLVLLVLVSGFAAYVGWGLPSRSEVESLAQKRPGLTGVMKQREQEARRKGRKPRHVQAWVPLSHTSRKLIEAVIASEDQRFFGHEGVDWAAIQKSVEVNAQKGRFARGGSTITQQLAKNLFFSTHRSPLRKLRELVVTYWLERDLSKARILELYLNVIEWGDGIYGAQAAAQTYYGKPASAVDENEAAGLVAMIPNPRRINPRVDAKRHARAQRRVLWLMAHAGFLKGDLRGLGAEPPPEVVDEDEPPPADAGDEPLPPTPPPAVDPPRGGGA